MASIKNNSFLIHLLSISLAFAVGGLAGQVTQAAIPEWYAQLNKPFFNPPNIIFEGQCLADLFGPLGSI